MNAIVRILDGGLRRGLDWWVIKLRKLGWRDHTIGFEIEGVIASGSKY